jgi:beta propeller repeat protein
LVAPGAIGASPATSDPTLEKVERQITTNPGDDYDPSISGDLVVYTASRNNDLDVYYVDLDDGVEHAITAQPGAQELADVAAPLIVYTDFTTSDINLYSTLTGEAVNLTSATGGIAMNPAISSQIVVWEDQRDGNFEIYAMNLATGEERRVTNSTAIDSTPAVRDSRIVWQVCEMGVCDIALYDWNTGLTQMLTQTADRDERRPDLDGNYVTFDAYSMGERDVYAHDLTTGEERRLTLTGSQNNPNVSGDVVALEDVSTGVYHIMLWHLPTNTTFQLTEGAEGEYLNDIDGNRVVYTAQRSGQLDIYLTEFTLNLVTPYQFTGFFPPVDNDVYNLVKAGRAVPVKFSLAGDQGLDIFPAGSPSSQPVSCEAGVPTDVVESTVTAGGSSLSYDASTNQYTYVWKTSQSWAGTCRKLIVELDDGTEHTALFKLTR